MTQHMKRRTFLAAAGGVGAGGLLGACGSSHSGSSLASTAGRNGVTSSTPRSGGSVIFGTESEINSFDPATGRYDETGVLYARTVYDPLAIIAADGTTKPYLAASVTPNPDYSVWTIKARPGVTFHDGTPCDAAAIAGSMNHFNSGQLGIVIGGPIKSIVATDPETVTVTLKQPWVPFDRYLAGGIGGQIGYVIAPSMIQAIKTNPNAQVTPVGTGPFVFKKWEPNVSFTATRNPHYWRKGMPYLDSITYQPMPDADSRVEALQAGTIDLLHEDVAKYSIQFMNDTSYGYANDLGSAIGEPDMDFLLLNTTAPPIDDIRVRKAMAMAIDQSGYRSVINSGLNPEANQPFSPGTPYYNPKSGYPDYDPNGAKALIAQVQRDLGKPVAFTMNCANSPGAVQAAQYLIANLNAVGMQVSLQQIQQDELISNALSGNFTCNEWRQFSAVDPDMNYIFWSPTTILRPLKTFVNMAQNADPAVEAALQKGRTAADLADRAAAYQEVAQLFAKDLPYIYYDRAVWSVVTRPRVQNWNNATCPDGTKALPMNAGMIWPTQIWVAG